MAQLAKPARQFLAELDDELLDSEERTTIYLTSRARGTAPRMARMFALRRPPGARTGDQWWAGNHGQTMDERMGPEYAARTRKLLSQHGVNMSPWDDYVPEVARFPGDPAAVISGHQGPREQLQRALRLQAAHIAAQETAPRVALAEDIIQDRYEAIAREHPEVRKVSAAEKARIRRDIIKKHAYRPEEAGVEV